MLAGAGAGCVLVPGACVWRACWCRVRACGVRADARLQQAVWCAACVLVQQVVLVPGAACVQRAGAWSRAVAGGRWWWRLEKRCAVVRPPPPQPAVCLSVSPRVGRLEKRCAVCAPSKGDRQ